jgi:hypothetical protein
MKWIALAVVLTLVGAGVAVAQPAKEAPAGPPPHGMFKEADANGDGFLNKEEWVNGHAKKFDEIDADRDGKLTREELRAFHEANPHPKAPRPDGSRRGGERPARGAPPAQEPAAAPAAQ